MTFTSKMAATAIALTLALGGGSAAFAKAHDQGIADGINASGGFAGSQQGGTGVGGPGGVSSGQNGQNGNPSRGDIASGNGSENAVEPVVTEDPPGLNKSNG